MFNILFRQQAAKRLLKINEPYFSAIKKEILLLQKNYFPAGKNCKRLQGKEKDLYRIRIGNYRSLYHVDHGKKTITVLRIFNRNEGY
ncbi:MAG: type II toxin-antitoxin system RelE/ParE family toxin [Patescibacteria group bacterium]